MKHSRKLALLRVVMNFALGSFKRELDSLSKLFDIDSWEAVVEFSNNKARLLSLYSTGILTTRVSSMVCGCLASGIDSCDCWGGEVAPGDTVWIWEIEASRKASTSWRLEETRALDPWLSTSSPVSKKRVCEAISIAVFALASFEDSNYWDQNHRSLGKSC